jgi:hypothetical protein
MAMGRFHHARALGLLAWLAVAPQALACGPSMLERAVVERVTQDGDIVLQDQRRVRLAGVHLLGDETDRWSRHAGLVFVLLPDGAPVWLQQRLLDKGAAIARPEAGLGDCWGLLTRLETARIATPVQSVVEAGRFASIAGQVRRIGEGRSAHFISLIEPSGMRVAGMIQKRHLKRFKDAGVDVARLQGHVIRMRGVRSAANPAVIPLTSAEQIEIVR